MNNIERLPSFIESRADLLDRTHEDLTNVCGNCDKFQKEKHEELEKKLPEEEVVRTEKHIVELESSVQRERVRNPEFDKTGPVREMARQWLMDDRRSPRETAELTAGFFNAADLA